MKNGLAFIDEIKIKDEKDRVLLREEISFFYFIHYLIIKEFVQSKKAHKNIFLE
ncbi:MAG: hypothetical protein N4A62_00470 [Marinisporobacter sp.]|nr:hypothetical protein [Marinisporobacter sp.]